MAAMSLAAVLCLSAAFISAKAAENANNPHGCDTPAEGFQCNASTAHAWGQYSPYFKVPSAIDSSVPPGCEVTFVQLLSRHGARDPTASKTAYYNDTVVKLQGSVSSYGETYEFIKDFEYSLGADQLTPFGRQQMVNSGTKFYQRYRSLASKAVPFIRASGQDRVLDSAANWAMGLHQARQADRTSTTPPDLPYDMLIIPELPGFNNTLHHGLCTVFEEGPYSSMGHAAQKTWLSMFAPPIAARLNHNLPGADLALADVITIMDLCPFVTVASEGGGVLSQFCSLFTADEWASYDYYETLGKWYGYGPGNPLGPTQGVGFVNELVARLMQMPVVDHTATNRSLDGAHDTFPLDRTLYADFSHDNDMTAVLSALGLYNGTTMLSNTTRQTAEQAGGYATSWTVPFAARIYVEKMLCGGEEELVRVLVNDRVMPLVGCHADQLGRCALSRFVDGLGFARGGGLWGECFP